MSLAKIGEDGKKYGLILTGNKKQAQQQQQQSTTIKKRANIFDNSDNDDDAEDVNAGESEFQQMMSNVRKESIQSRLKRQTQLTVEKALKEDPTVFQYDELFDEVSSSATTARQEMTKTNQQRKAKYATSLLKTAATRQVERDLQMERKAQRERELEDGIYDDKPTFVTEAYKKKIAERESAMKQLESKTSIEDVTKQDDLSNFYRNILDTKTNKVQQNKNKDDEESTVVEKAAAVKTTPTINSSSHESSTNSDNEKESRNKTKKHHSHHHHRSYSSKHVRTAAEALEDELKKKKKTLAIPEKDLDKIAEARQRYLARIARGRGPIIESDSD